MLWLLVFTTNVQAADLFSPWLKLQQNGPLPSGACPSINTFLLPVSLELYDFGLRGNDVKSGDGLVEVTLNPCGVPKLTAGLVPGTTLKIPVTDTAAVTIDTLFLTSRGESTLIGNLPDSYSGLLHGSITTNILNVSSKLDLAISVDDNKLGSLKGSWDVDLSPVQFRGTLDLQDFSDCQSDSVSKPWLGSGSIGFQLPSSCLELQASLTYHRCAKDGEPLVTVVSASPSSFFLGGVGVDYAEMNMTGTKFTEWQNVSELRSTTFTFNGQVIAQNFGQFDSVNEGGSVTVSQAPSEYRDVWYWNGTVQGVLAARFGSEAGAAAVGVKVHILNNEVAKFEVGFRYNSSFLELDGYVFVDARECSAGELAPTTASMKGYMSGLWGGSHDQNTAQASMAGTYNKCADSPGQTVLHMKTTTPTTANFGSAFQIKKAELDLNFIVGSNGRDDIDDGLLAIINPKDLGVTGTVSGEAAIQALSFGAEVTMVDNQVATVRAKVKTQPTKIWVVEVQGFSFDFAFHAADGNVNVTADAAASVAVGGRRLIDFDSCIHTTGGGKVMIPIGASSTDVATGSIQVELTRCPTNPELKDKPFVAITSAVSTTYAAPMIFPGGFVIAADMEVYVSMQKPIILDFNGYIRGKASFEALALTPKGFIHMNAEVLLVGNALKSASVNIDFNYGGLRIQGQVVRAQTPLGACPVSSATGTATLRLDLPKYSTVVNANLVFEWNRCAAAVGESLFKGTGTLSAVVLDTIRLTDVKINLDYTVRDVSGTTAALLSGSLSGTIEVAGIKSTGILRVRDNEVLDLEIQASYSTSVVAFNAAAAYSFGTCPVPQARGTADIKLNLGGGNELSGALGLEYDRCATSQWRAWSIDPMAVRIGTFRLENVTMEVSCCPFTGVLAAQVKDSTNLGFTSGLGLAKRPLLQISGNVFYSLRPCGSHTELALPEKERASKAALAITVTVADVTIYGSGSLIFDNCDSSFSVKSSMDLQAGGSLLPLDFDSLSATGSVRLSATASSGGLRWSGEVIGTLNLQKTSQAEDFGTKNGLKVIGSARIVDNSVTDIKALLRFAASDFLAVFQVDFLLQDCSASPVAPRSSGTGEIHLDLPLETRDTVVFAVAVTFDKCAPVGGDWLTVRSSSSNEAEIVIMNHRFFAKMTVDLTARKSPAGRTPLFSGNVYALLDAKFDNLDWMYLSVTLQVQDNKVQPSNVKAGLNWKYEDILSVTGEVTYEQRGCTTNPPPQKGSGSVQLKAFGIVIRASTTVAYNKCDLSKVWDVSFSSFAASSTARRQLFAVAQPHFSNSLYTKKNSQGKLELFGNMSASLSGLVQSVAGDLAAVVVMEQSAVSAFYGHFSLTSAVLDVSGKVSMDMDSSCTSVGTGYAAAFSGDLSLNVGLPSRVRFSATGLYRPCTSSGTVWELSASLVNPVRVGNAELRTATASASASAGFQTWSGSLATSLAIAGVTCSGSASFSSSSTVINTLRVDVKYQYPAAGTSPGQSMQLTVDGSLDLSFGSCSAGEQRLESGSGSLSLSFPGLASLQASGSLQYNSCAGAGDVVLAANAAASGMWQLQSSHLDSSLSASTGGTGLELKDVLLALTLSHPATDANALTWSGSVRGKAILLGVEVEAYAQVTDGVLQSFFAEVEYRSPEFDLDATLSWGAVQRRLRLLSSTSLVCGATTGVCDVSSLCSTGAVGGSGSGTMTVRLDGQSVSLSSSVDFKKCDVPLQSCSASQLGLNGGFGLKSSEPTWKVSAPSISVALNLLGVSVTSQVTALVSGTALLCSGSSGGSFGGMYWSGSLSGSGTATIQNNQLVVGTKMAFNGARLSSVSLDVVYSTPSLSVVLVVSSASAACTTSPAATSGSGTVTVGVTGTETLSFGVSASYNKCATAGQEMLRLDGLLNTGQVVLFGQTFSATMSLSIVASRSLVSDSLSFSGSASGTMRGATAGVEWLYLSLSFNVVDNSVKSLGGTAQVTLNFDNKVTFSGSVKYSTVSCAMSSVPDLGDATVGLIAFGKTYTVSVKLKRDRCNIPEWSIGTPTFSATRRSLVSSGLSVTTTNNVVFERNSQGKYRWDGTFSAALAGDTSLVGGQLLAKFVVADSSLRSVKAEFALTSAVLDVSGKVSMDMDSSCTSVGTGYAAAFSGDLSLNVGLPSRVRFSATGLYRPCTSSGTVWELSASLVNPVRVGNAELRTATASASASAGFQTWSGSLATSLAIAGVTCSGSASFSSSSTVINTLRVDVKYQYPAAGTSPGQSMQLTVDGSLDLSFGSCSAGEQRLESGSGSLSLSFPGLASLQASGSLQYNSCAGAGDVVLAVNAAASGMWQLQSSHLDSSLSASTGGTGLELKDVLLALTLSHPATDANALTWSGSVRGKAILLGVEVEAYAQVTDGVLQSFFAEVEYRSPEFDLDATLSWGAVQRRLRLLSSTSLVCGATTGVCDVSSLCSTGAVGGSGSGTMTVRLDGQSVSLSSSVDFKKCDVPLQSCSASQLGLNGGFGLKSSEPTWKVSAPSISVALNLLGVSVTSQVTALVSGTALLCSGSSGGSFGGMYWSGSLSGSGTATIQNNQLVVGTKMAFNGARLSSVSLDVAYSTPSLSVVLVVSSASAACTTSPAATSGSGTVTVGVTGTETLSFGVSASYNKCATAGQEMLRLDGLLNTGQVVLFGQTFSATMSLSIVASRSLVSDSLSFSGSASGTMRGATAGVEWLYLSLSFNVVDNSVQAVDVAVKLDFKYTNVLTFSGSVNYATAACSLSPAPQQGSGSLALNLKIFDIAASAKLSITYDKCSSTNPLQLGMDFGGSGSSASRRLNVFDGASLQPSFSNSLYTKKNSQGKLELFGNMSASLSGLVQNVAGDLAAVVVMEQSAVSAFYGHFSLTSAVLDVSGKVSMDMDSSCTSVGTGYAAAFSGDLSLNVGLPSRVRFSATGLYRPCTSSGTVWELSASLVNPVRVGNAELRTATASASASAGFQTWSGSLATSLAIAGVTCSGSASFSSSSTVINTLRVDVKYQYPAAGTSPGQSMQLTVDGSLDLSFGSCSAGEQRLESGSGSLSLSFPGLASLQASGSLQYNSCAGAGDVVLAVNATASGMWQLQSSHLDSSLSASTGGTGLELKDVLLALTLSHPATDANALTWSGSVRGKAILLGVEVEAYAQVVDGVLQGFKGFIRYKTPQIDIHLQLVWGAVQRRLRLLSSTPLVCSATTGVCDVSSFCSRPGILGGSGGGPWALRLHEQDVQLVASVDFKKCDAPLQSCSFQQWKLNGGYGLKASEPTWTFLGTGNAQVVSFGEVTLKADFKAELTATALLCDGSRDAVGNLLNLDGMYWAGSLTGSGTFYEMFTARATIAYGADTVGSTTIGFEFEQPGIKITGQGTYLTPAGCGNLILSGKPAVQTATGRVILSDLPLSLPPIDIPVSFEIPCQRTSGNIIPPWFVQAVQSQNLALQHQTHTIPLSSVKPRVSYRSKPEPQLDISLDGNWQRLKFSTALSVSVGGGSFAANVSMVAEIMNPADPYTVQMLLSTLSFGLLDGPMETIKRKMMATGSVYSTLASAVLLSEIDQAKLEMDMDIQNAFLMVGQIEISFFGVAKVSAYIEVRETRPVAGSGGASQWDFVLVVRARVNAPFSGTFLKFLELVGMVGADASVYVVYATNPGTRICFDQAISFGAGLSFHAEIKAKTSPDIAKMRAAIGTNNQALGLVLGALQAGDAILLASGHFSADWTKLNLRISIMDVGVNLNKLGEVGGAEIGLAVGQALASEAVKGFSINTLHAMGQIPDTLWGNIQKAFLSTAGMTAAVAVSGAATIGGATVGAIAGLLGADISINQLDILYTTDSNGVPVGATAPYSFGLHLEATTAFGRGTAAQVVALTMDLYQISAEESNPLVTPPMILTGNGTLSTITPAGCLAPNCRFYPMQYGMAAVWPTATETALGTWCNQLVAIGSSVGFSFAIDEMDQFFPTKFAVYIPPVVEFFGVPMTPSIAIGASWSAKQNSFAIAGVLSWNGPGGGISNLGALTPFFYIATVAMTRNLFLSLFLQSSFQDVSLSFNFGPEPVSQASISPGMQSYVDQGDIYPGIRFRILGLRFFNLATWDVPVIETQLQWYGGNYFMELQFEMGSACLLGSLLCLEGVDLYQDFPSALLDPCAQTTTGVTPFPQSVMAGSCSSFGGMVNPATDLPPGAGEANCPVTCSKKVPILPCSVVNSRPNHVTAADGTAYCCPGGISGCSSPSSSSVSGKSCATLKQLGKCSTSVPGMAGKCCATCGAATCPRSVSVNARMGWPLENNYMKVQGQVQIFYGLAKSALFVEATATYARFYSKTTIFNAYSVEVFMSANWNIFTSFDTSQVSFYVNLEAMRAKIIAGVRDFTQGIVDVLDSMLNKAQKAVEFTKRVFHTASAALKKVQQILADTQATALRSLKSSWEYARDKRENCGKCKGFGCLAVPANCAFWLAAEASTWTAYHTASLVAIPVNAVVDAGFAAAQTAFTVAQLAAEAAVQALASLQTAFNKLPGWFAGVTADALNLFSIEQIEMSGLLSPGVQQADFAVKGKILGASFSQSLKIGPISAAGVISGLVTSVSSNVHSSLNTIFHFSNNRRRRLVQSADKSFNCTGTYCAEPKSFEVLFSTPPDLDPKAACITRPFHAYKPLPIDDLGNGRSSFSTGFVGSAASPQEAPSGSPCSFPFTFNGAARNSCVQGTPPPGSGISAEDWALTGSSGWCFTDGTATKWGVCSCTTSYPSLSYDADTFLAARGVDPEASTAKPAFAQCDASFVKVPTAHCAEHAVAHGQAGVVDLSTCVLQAAYCCPASSRKWDTVQEDQGGSVDSIGDCSGCKCMAPQPSAAVCPDPTTLRPVNKTLTLTDCTMSSQSTFEQTLAMNGVEEVYIHDLITAPPPAPTGLTFPASALTPRKVFISLRDAGLVGELPFAVPYSAGDLVNLDLSMNLLTGSLPEHMEAWGKNLVSLDVTQNQMSGSLDSIGSLSNLEVLLLEQNHFNIFPKELAGLLAKMPQLQIAAYDNNNMQNESSLLPRILPDAVYGVLQLGMPQSAFCSRPGQLDQLCSPQSAFADKWALIGLAARISCAVSTLNVPAFHSPRVTVRQVMPWGTMQVGQDLTAASLVYYTVQPSPADESKVTSDDLTTLIGRLPLLQQQTSATAQASYNTACGKPSKTCEAKPCELASSGKRLMVSFDGAVWSDLGAWVPVYDVLATAYNSTLPSCGGGVKMCDAPRFAASNVADANAVSAVFKSIEDAVERASDTSTSFASAFAPAEQKLFGSFAVENSFGMPACPPGRGGRQCELFCAGGWVRSGLIPFYRSPELERGIPQPWQMPGPRRNMSLFDPEQVLPHCKPLQCQTDACTAAVRTTFKACEAMVGYSYSADRAARCTAAIREGERLCTSSEDQVCLRSVEDWDRQTPVPDSFPACTDAGTPIAAPDTAQLIATLGIPVTFPLHFASDCAFFGIGWVKRPWSRCEGSAVFNSNSCRNQAGICCPSSSAQACHASCRCLPDLQLELRKEKLVPFDPHPNLGQCNMLRESAGVDTNIFGSPTPAPAPTLFAPAPVPVPTSGEPRAKDNDALATSWAEISTSPGITLQNSKYAGGEWHLPKDSSGAEAMTTTELDRLYALVARIVTAMNATPASTPFKTSASAFPRHFNGWQLVYNVPACSFVGDPARTLALNAPPSASREEVHAFLDNLEDLTTTRRDVGGWVVTPPNVCGDGFTFDNPCLYGGQCHTVGGGSFSCSCSGGRFGERCEREVKTIIQVVLTLTMDPLPAKFTGEQMGILTDVVAEILRIPSSFLDVSEKSRAPRLLTQAQTNQPRLLRAQQVTLGVRVTTNETVSAEDLKQKLASKKAVFGAATQAKWPTPITIELLSFEVTLLWPKPFIDHGDIPISRGDFLKNFGDASDFAGGNGKWLFAGLEGAFAIVMLCCLCSCGFLYRDWDLGKKRLPLGDVVEKAHLDNAPLESPHPLVVQQDPFPKLTPKSLPGWLLRVSCLDNERYRRFTACSCSACTLAAGAFFLLIGVFFFKALKKMPDELEVSIQPLPPLSDNRNTLEVRQWDSITVTPHLGLPQIELKDADSTISTNNFCAGAGNSRRLTESTDLRHALQDLQNRAMRACANSADGENNLKAIRACNATRAQALDVCADAYHHSNCALPFAWDDFVCYAALEAKDNCANAAEEASALCLAGPHHQRDECEARFAAALGAASHPDRRRAATLSLGDSNLLNGLCGGVLADLFSKKLEMKWSVGFTVNTTLPVAVNVAGGDWGLNFYGKGKPKRRLALFKLDPIIIPAKGSGTIRGEIDFEVNAVEVFGGLTDLLTDIIDGHKITFGIDSINMSASAAFDVAGEEKALTLDFQTSKMSPRLELNFDFFDLKKMGIKLSVPLEGKMESCIDTPRIGRRCFGILPPVLPTYAVTVGDLLRNRRRELSSNTALSTPHTTDTHSRRLLQSGIVNQIMSLAWKTIAENHIISLNSLGAVVVKIPSKIKLTFEQPILLRQNLPISIEYHSNPFNVILIDERFFKSGFQLMRSREFKVALGEKKRFGALLVGFETELSLFGKEMDAAVAVLSNIIEGKDLQWRAQNYDAHGEGKFMGMTAEVDFPPFDFDFQTGIHVEEKDYKFNVSLTACAKARALGDGKLCLGGKCLPLFSKLVNLGLSPHKVCLDLGPSGINVAMERRRKLATSSAVFDLLSQVYKGLKIGFKLKIKPYLDRLNPIMYTLMVLGSISLVISAMCVAVSAYLTYEKLKRRRQTQAELVESDAGAEKGAKETEGGERNSDETPPEKKSSTKKGPVKPVKFGALEQNLEDTTITRRANFREDI